MIDDILYSKETPFSPEIFKKVEIRGYERILLSDNDFSYLRINTDDIILSVNIENDFEDKFKWLRSTVSNYFQNVLFHNHDIKFIKRIGVVYYHEFNAFRNLDRIITEVTENQITGANNIKLSFSKKFPVAEPLVKKGINHYVNVISNLEQKETKLNISLDYQYCYDPQVTDLRDCDISKNFDNSREYANNHFYKWVDNYVEAK